MSGRLSTWLPLALLATALLAPGPLAAQALLTEVEVTELEFVGNQAFPEDSLRLAIMNRETSCRGTFLVVFCWFGAGFAFDRQYLIARELDRDALRLEAFYLLRGYREAQVDTAVAYGSDDEARVTFLVDEGRPVLIDSLTFTGADALGGDRLIAGLPIAEGQPLNDIRLDQARDSILTRLKNEGYPHADVFRSRSIPAGDPYSARVRFDIDPGPLAQVGELDIVVSGEAELSDDVVRRMLPFQQGSTYRESDIRVAQRNLYNLEIVRNALISVDSTRMRSPMDELVPLRIEVGTSTLYRVRTGGGWNEADCVNAEARWASRNVFGGAQRLQVTGQVSNLLAEGLHNTACTQSGVGDFGGLNWNVSAEVQFPWIFSPRNAFSMSFFVERQSVPDVFVRQAIGMAASLTRSLAVRTPLVLSYRPQRSRLEAAGIFFCTSLLVCNPEDISVLEGANALSPVALGLSRDRTNSLLNPTAGYTASAEVEYASLLTGSDFSYVRVTGETSRFWDLPGSGILAARVRGGWVGAAEFGRIDSGVDILHPQTRFFAGGANSTRGYAQNRLGPGILTVAPRNLIGPAQEVGLPDTTLVGVCTAAEIEAFTCDADALDDDAFTPRPTGGTRMLEGNLELRMSLSDRFQGVTFVDFGQVWNERTRVDLSALEWTPGIGVRYFSPIGPLRLDVAYRFGGGTALPVVTSLLRPAEEADRDPRNPNDRLVRVDLVDRDGEVIEGPDGATREYFTHWVRLDQLALLAPSVTYGADRSFFRRLQIHLSIGQAF